MKANTVRLPSLVTAVASQQWGDRTDGPKLWNKGTPSPRPREGKLGTEGRARLHTARINSLFH